jgi:hypothetical protein
MDTVGSILPKVLRKRGLAAHADAAHITLRAHQWITKALPEVADAVVARSFSHAVLTLEYSHSIVAQECQPMLPALKQYLQREFPKLKLEEVRLLRGRK